MSFLKKIFNNTEENQNISKVAWIPVTDLDQLDDMADKSNEQSILIFKHSTRCAISRMALKQFENEYNIAADKMKLYFLDLLEYRSISNEITERFGVVHQSPQLIVIKDGKAVYNASHSDIQAEDILNFV
ncbi:bacillithiol system redox-active protein YtxJ [Flavobacterium sp.]|uniref:bacillithiol system redox-active protein YtxJ n=1 Tax=Flavobacterium sp. TaxID=239 RepID=UPI003D6A4DBA